MVILQDNTGDYKTQFADSHNPKEIRDVLINLHDQLEEMNTWVSQISNLWLPFLRRCFSLVFVVEYAFAKISYCWHYQSKRPCGKEQVLSFKSARLKKKKSAGHARFAGDMRNCNQKWKSPTTRLCRKSCPPWRKSCRSKKRRLTLSSVSTKKWEPLWIFTPPIMHSAE